RVIGHLGPLSRRESGGGRRKWTRAVFRLPPSVFRLLRGRVPSGGRSPHALGERPFQPLESLTAMGVQVPEPPQRTRQAHARRGAFCWRCAGARKPVLSLVEAPGQRRPDVVVLVLQAPQQSPPFRSVKPGLRLL